jgi:hypothetical protein
MHASIVLAYVEAATKALVFTIVAGGCAVGCLIGAVVSVFSKRRGAKMRACLLFLVGVILGLLVWRVDQIAPLLLWH